MSRGINDVASDFQAEDFMPGCTIELGEAGLHSEFAKRKQKFVNAWKATKPYQRIVSLPE